MKINEAIVHQDKERLLEKELQFLYASNQITESFIDDKILSKIKSLAKAKADKKEKYKSQYEAKVKKYEQEVTASGVDPKDIKDIAEKKARAISPDNMNKSIISKQMGEMFDEMKAKGFSDLTFPIVTLAIIIFINTVMMIAFFSVTGSMLAASYMAAVLVAPVTEEIGKYLNIKRQDGGRYLIIFSIAEYSIYMFQTAIGGGSLIGMAMIRLIAVMMHTYWTAIMRDKIQAGDTSPMRKTMILHALFNMFPLLGVFTIIAGNRKQQGTFHKNIT